VADAENLVELDESTFDEVTGGEGIVIVDFWAAWCGPCKAFAPIFEEAAAENRDITFAKVDIDANPKVAARVGIQSVPTLLAYRGGELVSSRIGAMSKAAFAEVIDATRA
jgi:thioredoxin 1